jgi:hypothetical protein
MNLLHRWLPVCSLALLAASPLAHAALGSAPTSVDADRLAMRANVVSQSTGLFTVHTLTLPRGTVVREYVSAAGIVFAVAWQGPAMPDLRRLLGTHADEAATSMRAFRNKHGGIGPISAQTDDLVIQSGGHMGAFRGRAWQPSAIPSGFSVSDID